MGAAFFAFYDSSQSKFIKKQLKYNHRLTIKALKKLDFNTSESHKGFPPLRGLHPPEPRLFLSAIPDNFATAYLRPVLWMFDQENKNSALCVAKMEKSIPENEQSADLLLKKCLQLSILLKHTKKPDTV